MTTPTVNLYEKLYSRNGYLYTKKKTLLQFSKNIHNRLSYYVFYNNVYKTRYVKDNLYLVRTLVYKFTHPDLVIYTYAEFQPQRKNPYSASK